MKKQLDLNEFLSRPPKQFPKKRFGYGRPLQTPAAQKAQETHKDDATSS
ncbi:hypothetical protein [Maritimibacter harenae]|nr:hypothetical protein [Maritimibacter harenae]